MPNRQRLTDKDLTKAIIAAAVKLRADGLCASALGTECELEIEGVLYVAVVEEHYHEPGGKMRPWGKHHGISMFRVMEDKVSQPRILHWKTLAVQVSFLSARQGTWQVSAVDREVRLICLHSAECAESAQAAESLQSWGAGKTSPLASWHFACDNNSITQSVEIHNIAWHAGPINGYSVGIEQAGRASQTAEQWADEYSRGVLENTARLIALLAGLYDLPIEHCDNPKAPGARGVCTHADVTRAWGTKGGHWDPGPNYPLESVLVRARQIQLDAAKALLERKS